MFFFVSICLKDRISRILGMITMSKRVKHRIVQLSPQLISIECKYWPEIIVPVKIC